MRRICSVALVIAILLTLSPLLALAQPNSYNELFSADPMYSISAGKAERYIGTVDAQVKGFGLKVSPFNGYVVAGLAGAARVDYNGKGGTAVGVFGIAEGSGVPGARNEVVGLYGMAWKSGSYWAAGTHSECILEDGEEDADGRKDSGGTCIGHNIELIGNNQRSGFIGINIQPRAGAHDVRGLQFQIPAAYRWSVDFGGTFVKLGQTGDIEFCMRFQSQSQRLEFWHGCSEPGARRVGYIDMSYGAKDAKLNR